MDQLYGAASSPVLSHPSRHLAPLLVAQEFSEALLLRAGQNPALVRDSGHWLQKRLPFRGAIA